MCLNYFSACTICNIRRCCVGHRYSSPCRTVSLRRLSSQSMKRNDCVCWKETEWYHPMTSYSTIFQYFSQRRVLVFLLLRGPFNPTIFCVVRNYCTLTFLKSTIFFMVLYLNLTNFHPSSLKKIGFCILQKKNCY